MPDAPSPVLRAVKRRMAALGLTQKELAQQAGVDQGTVGSFLRGEREPRVTSMVKLEIALGWEPGYLDQVAAGETPSVHQLSPRDTAAQALFATHGAATTIEKIGVLNELIAQVVKEESSRTR